MVEVALEDTALAVVVLVASVVVVPLVDVDDDVGNFVVESSVVEVRLVVRLVLVVAAVVVVTTARCEGDVVEGDIACNGAMTAERG